MENTAFREAYKKLNPEQRQAVDTVDGPLLVIAGPGTGKTQLLSARVAHILEVTDTLPQNILCLTFTESGAANMRERLSRFIGKQAYDVQIGTYHAFGGDLIRRFPEYFTELRLEQPVDELGKYQIVLDIVARLSYRDPLKQTQHHLRDLIATISEVKRALLSADDLRAIASENRTFIQRTSEDVAETFTDFKIMPRSLEKALPYFENTLTILQKYAPESPVNTLFGSIATIGITELEKAIAQATEQGKTKPLTAWKNSWLTKTERNTFAFAGRLETERVASLASVMEQYQAALEKQGLYDFDDMILRSIAALEQHDDLRFTLQEQYLYILLDEYQDTNAAQAKIVELLTNNPLQEGRPNVMAVGDDDQAIYAFQGAQYSNMRDFFNAYRDTKIIQLRENYRSQSDILSVASHIASQIGARLTTDISELSKELVAANQNLPKTFIERRDFLSDVAEHAYIADQIKTLIASGTAPKEIAVLAPQHKYLEALVAHLNKLEIPVSYEKRENILRTPAVEQLLAMAQLVQALQTQNLAIADQLWPEVLSYDFWQLNVEEIWRTAWSIKPSNSESDNPTHWTEALLAHQNEDLQDIAQFFLQLASRAHTTAAEQILDELTGNTAVLLNNAKTMTSPLRAFYADKSDASLYELTSHLAVLRAKVRERQAAQDNAFVLDDILQLVSEYEAAGQPLRNTSPYNQAADAVQLMTVFKAKGLEFAHVFLLSVCDQVWGSSGASNSNKLTLPANLKPIRHSGATEDERLRLFFVAITRARHGLHLSSHTHTYAGKATTRLKYLDERQNADDTITAHALPEQWRTVINDDTTAPSLAALQTDWRQRHAEALTDAPLAALLKERLQSYQISPTHLNSFCDLIYGGPIRFFYNTILRFPNAPNPNSEFGNTVHETLQWLQNQVNETGVLPEQGKTINYFAAHMRARKLPVHETELLIERGELALSAYLATRAHMFTPGVITEKSFRNEGVFVGEAHLAGNIDRLEVNKENKTITVVDYKTGKPLKMSKSDAKLHKYIQQLYCYKILIEGSHTYKGYSVQAGRLEFIEPDETGQICEPIIVDFQAEELEHTRQLLAALWRHVHALDFPNTYDYPTTLRGIKAFEDDLIAEY